MKSKVLGVGNALLDFQVKVPHTFIEKHGLTPGSMTLMDIEAQKKMMTESKEQFGKDCLRISSGGCAANTLAGLANFGANVRFLGKVANDKFGKRYTEDLKDAGVDCELHAGEGHTGTCLALITPDAERTMLTHLGIAVELSEKDVNKDEVLATEMLYIEGYLWDSPSAREACRQAIQIANDNNIPVAFTYSDMFCVDRYRADFVNLAKSHLNVLLCNEAEAKHATDTTDVTEAFKIMKDWCDVVAITCGAHGVLVSDRRKNEVQEVPTWSIKLVDKIGAGDLFASGFLYGITHGHSLREAGHLGCYAATRIVQQMSTRLEVSMKDEMAIALAGPKEIARPAHSIGGGSGNITAAATA